MIPGKVYLVGAGPGHPELLTVKAARLLEASDVIIYDRLIQQDILALAKPGAERIYMGKPVGRHASRQSEIHELMAAKARAGKTVVRLKGGDPFLFGRGGEEAEYLAGHGVPFEVIPGVSSALAAPLSAGIPLTHRDVASSVAIVTGHEADRDESRTNWSALAGMDTLVFLMAVHSVDRIARELIAHGRDPGTPAAMIQMAFWRGEKVVCGTLDSIGREVERAQINPPATLVIGEVVRLREKLQSSHHDLSEHTDATSYAEPAPSPDQLLRMATAGIGSQVLLFALTASVFDHLEEWHSAQDLAGRLGLNRYALAEMLECLVPLGLIESGPEGYRNLELASRYLVTGSPQSLTPLLLSLAAHTAPVTSIGRYLLDGRESGAPAEFYRLQKEACECLARYAAPFVTDRLDLSEAGRVLLFGWGGEVYRELIRNRWPRLEFQARNPFAEEAPGDPAAALTNGSGGYGAVIFSGLLPCCEREQFRPALERAAGLLPPHGTLILHDSFLPEDLPAAPEIALAALRRHVVHGGSRNWSLARLRAELASLGLVVTVAEALAGASYLVTATMA
jgi:uroporphyrin-III C-methyltransferase